MTENICGNCANFKPKQGEKFFSCTDARQGGIKYGMQVRADTCACDAFTVLAKPTPPAGPGQRPVVKSAPQVTPKAAAPRATQKPPAKPVEERPRPRGLCVWGRVILIVSAVMVVALVSWVTYACVSSSGGATPTPTSTITPTLGNFSMGQWGETSIQSRTVASATMVDFYDIPFSPRVYAPPGTVFIIVNASTILIGEVSLATSPGDFVIKDSEGRRYSFNEYKALYPYPTTTLTKGQQSAGGKILYTVPLSASGLEVHCLLQGAQPVLAVWKLQW